VRAEIFEALPDHVAPSDGDITLLLGKGGVVAPRYAWRERWSL
jgi:hypothetical protein